MVYSMAGHKEWRFIHPILPILHMFAAKALVDLSTPGSQKGKAVQTMPKSSILSIRKNYVYFILATVPVSIYTTLFYCSAPISVMSYIRNLPPNELEGGVGFLMPCHSTPGHAYLHRDGLARGRLWSLGCEPPLEYVTSLCIYCFFN